jgi:hypothetical protein
MKNFIASLAVCLAVATLADARIFRSVDDCVCTVPPAANQYVAPSSYPTQAQLTAIFPVAERTVGAAPKRVAVGKIDGTAKLREDAGKIYTVLCLPRGYKSCRHCMEVLNAFNRDRDLIELRGQTHYYVMIDGRPEFTNKWVVRVPEVRRGATVVLLMQGSRVLGREVSPNLVGFGDRFKKKICDKFCDDCKPDEEPIDEEPPIDEEEPDTTIIQPPLETADKETNPLMLAIVGLTVGFVAWFAMFRRGT